MRADVECPYCGERNEIFVDPSGGRVQSYVEDCHVCCRPWQVRVTVSADDVDVELRTESDEM
ncbi:MAG TPA: CPXCG motif-containing cysteine-rich protein [Thermoanaerobaculia bacterium]|nr:CPXCG motif-containing cysteine-rich protein [Thermoanaerobaculia bacterium]